jgi:hypothetical protein
MPIPTAPLSGVGAIQEVTLEAILGMDTEQASKLYYLPPTRLTSTSGLAMKGGS